MVDREPLGHVASMNDKAIHISVQADQVKPKLMRDTGLMEFAK